MDAALIEAAFKLPDVERRELADRLYASLDRTAEEATLSSADEQELAAAVEEFQTRGPQGRSWPDVRAAIESGQPR